MGKAFVCVISEKPEASGLAQSQSDITGMVTATDSLTKLLQHKSDVLIFPHLVCPVR